MNNLSVILSCYSEDRLPFCKELLKGLAQQTMRDFQTIIIADGPMHLYEQAKLIVDQTSPPSPLVLCTGKTTGASATKNYGASVAGGELIAFLDDDVIPRTDWAEQILKFFTLHKHVDVITGAASPKWTDSTLAWFPVPLYWIISCTDWLGVNESPIDRLWSMNCVIRKKAFDAVGGFNERLGPLRGAQGGYGGVGEDVELAMRLKKNNYAIWFVPSVKCEHNVRSEQVTFRYILRRSLWIGWTRRNLKKSGTRMHVEFRLLKSLFSLRGKVDHDYITVSSLFLQFIALVSSLASIGFGFLLSYLESPTQS